MSQGTAGFRERCPNILFGFRHKTFEVAAEAKTEGKLGHHLLLKVKTVVWGKILMVKNAFKEWWKPWEISTFKGLQESEEAEDSEENQYNEG